MWVEFLSFPPMTFSLVQVSTVSRSECATWGNFHFHTFDHVKFTFPGTCTYVFASHCNDSYQDFNIQIRRSNKNSFLIYFTVTIDGVILEVKETGITVNGNKWVKAILLFSCASILMLCISIGDCMSRKGSYSAEVQMAVYDIHSTLNKVLQIVYPIVEEETRST